MQQKSGESQNGINENQWQKDIWAEKPQKINYVAGDLASVNCN